MSLGQQNAPPPRFKPDVYRMEHPMPDTDTRSLVERLRQSETDLTEQVASMNRALIAADVGDDSPYDGTSNIERASVVIGEAATALAASGEREEHLRAWVNRGLTQMVALMDSDPEAFVRAKCAGEIMDILEAEGPNRDPRAATGKEGE